MVSVKNNTNGMDCQKWENAALTSSHPPRRPALLHGKKGRSLGPYDQTWGKGPRSSG